MATTRIPRDATITGIGTRNPQGAIPGGIRSEAFTPDKVRITIDDIPGDADLIVTHPDDIVIDVDPIKKIAHIRRR